MKLQDYIQKKPEHAPYNPLTGKPSGSLSAVILDDDSAAGPRDSAREAACARPSSTAAPVARQAQESSPISCSAASFEPAATDAGAGIGASAALTGKGENEFSDSENGDFAPKIYSNTDKLLSHVRSFIDSKIVATILLGAICFSVIGMQDMLALALVFFCAYVLQDRFINVRRCVVIGGFAWLSVLIVGALVAESTRGPLIFNIQSLFVFCGFLLALAVCAAFFAGRYMYYYGYERGQLDADRIVAQHMVDRLIEHPDDWGTVDGDFVEVEGALNRVRDRQRAAEQALRDESARKNDLVTYLAHDLKTPLASVVGYLSLLEEAPDLPLEQRVRFTGVALDKAHRLDALIEEFFDITRFDFHDIVLTRGYVDLNLMLAQVVDEFYPTLTEQNKTAHIEVPAGLTVLVDGDKMARVFNNVMKNAIAYSYEGSTIQVSARRDEEGVRICFENQGDPIPAPKLKVIFEKFYRLDAARATNRGGAGLGLAIAKEIVVAHGGTISCTSTPEHTVFTVFLPE